MNFGETQGMKRVLLIEDEQDIASLLSARLTQAGYAVSVANSGEAGIRETVERLPDLVILDIMLPDMDGHTVCETLRRTFPSWVLPILMLTARDQTPDHTRAFVSGADFYMTKPYQPEALVNAVRLLTEDRPLIKPN